MASTSNPDSEKPSGEELYATANNMIGEWFEREIRTRDTIEVTATALANEHGLPPWIVKQVLDDLSDDPRVPIERHEHRYRVEL